MARFLGPLMWAAYLYNIFLIRRLKATIFKILVSSMHNNYCINVPLF
jgi:hypothetical protein